MFYFFTAIYLTYIYMVIYMLNLDRCLLSVAINGQICFYLMQALFVAHVFKFLNGEEIYD